MQKALKMAAESYYQANQNLLPKDIGDIEEVFAYTLHDNKLGIKYVITLDSDTNLCLGTAFKLVGAMEHILNKPIIEVINTIIPTNPEKQLINPFLCFNISFILFI